MSLFTAVLVVLAIYVCYKIGATALKWFLVLAVVVGGYCFFTYGGDINIKKPDGMPKLPELTSPLKK